MSAARARFAGLGLVALLAACAPIDIAKLPRMGVDFAFDPRNRCQGVSPRIQLSNVAPDVVAYDVEMIDLDAPGFRHWVQTVPATGPVIREGIGSGLYIGPCPPSGTHRYRITVTGRDAGKQPRAYGEKTVSREDVLERRREYVPGNPAEAAASTMERALPRTPTSMSTPCAAA